MFPPMELDGAELRLFEFGTVYRYEKSGVVHGLTRARGFTQDDSHIFCAPDQLADELASLLDFVVGLLRDFGLTEFEAELSTRPEKYVGTIENGPRPRRRCSTRSTRPVRSPSCSSQAMTTWPRARFPSGTATARRRTASPSRRRSPRS